MSPAAARAAGPQRRRPSPLAAQMAGLEAVHIDNASLDHVAPELVTLLLTNYGGFSGRVARAARRLPRAARREPAQR